MAESKEIIEFFTKSRLGIAIAIFLGFGALGEGVSKLGYFGKIADWIVKHGVNLKTGEATEGFDIGLTLATIALAILCCLWIRAELELDQILRRQTSSSQAFSATTGSTEAIKIRSNVALKTLQGTEKAMFKILNQTFPTGTLPPEKQVMLAKNTYLIHKNFDAEVQREYAVKAVDKTIHFWQMEMSVESAADEVEFIYDLGFSAKSIGWGDVAYIPSANQSRSKKVLVYFLPPIEPGENDPRKIIVTYKWPGMFRQLDKLGEETYAWLLDSANPIPLIDCRFYMEPGAGSVRCEVVGSNNGRQILREEVHPERHWPGWVYTVENAPTGRYKYALNLKFDRQVG
jgi:hypothetical protein